MIGIGIEAQARTRQSEVGGAGREHLDAFADVVSGYANRTSATLTGLLSFLAAAEHVENGLAPGEVEVAPDRVQVLTVHSAKGLEWEVVAVPHLTAGVFPSNQASATWLGSVAELPPTLRGDRAYPGESADGVPVLDLENLYHRKDLEDAIKSHKDALSTRRLDEDRRLFYVALTRTERALFVSGHHWAESGADPKGPSPFLLELEELVSTWEGERLGAIDVWAPAPDDGAENPLTATPRSALWPRDPLGRRRADVERGAELVREALAGLGKAAPEPEAADGDPDNWAADVDALLAERRERGHGGTDVEMPAQLSVSQLVDLAADPDALAARLRRPLPFPPNPLARRGTAFHAWVEQRFGATRLLDFDELPAPPTPGWAPRPSWLCCRTRSCARRGPTAAPSRWRCRSRRPSPGPCYAAGSTPSSPTPTAAGR